MKFENTFFADFKYWVREYNPETKASSIRKIPSEWECYEPDNNGTCTNLYIPEMRLRRSYGNSAFARRNYSPINPTEIVIREMYSKKGDYNKNPRIMYLDIETRVGTVSKGFPNPDKAYEPVSLIQFLDSETNKVHIIGDKEFYYKEWYLKQPDHKNAEVVYHHCNNELEMFEKFFGFIVSMKPAIVYAWNGDGFDYPYLYNRASRLRLDVNRFSPFSDQLKGDLVKAREVNTAMGYIMSLDVAGCYYIDIKDLYRKFVLTPRQSYSLNAIATVELGARKVDHSEFKTFDDFYLGNYTKPVRPTEDQKKTLCYLMSEKGIDEAEIKKAGHGQFVYYGVIDVVLLRDIDRKVGLTKLMVSVSERMNSRFSDVMGTTKPWANYIRNVLHKDNRVIVKESIVINEDLTVKGGFVRDPVAGKHYSVVSADVNSMYPMLSIAGLNMSPETFVFPRDIKSPDLKDFVIKHLNAGGIDSQNEERMLKLNKDPVKRATLMAMLERDNLAISPNGALFDKSRPGVVPGLVKDIYQQRKKTKKSMLSYEQVASLIEVELDNRK